MAIEGKKEKVIEVTWQDYQKCLSPLPKATFIALPGSTYWTLIIFFKIWSPKTW
jgi:hypothetical protein